MKKKLLIATTNKGKLAEFTSLDFFNQFEVFVFDDVSVADVEETADTLEGNALLKAHNAYETTKIASIADDTGMFVNAINGFPGIYCGRLAGNPRDFAKAAKIINDKLGDNPDRSVRFSSAIAFVDNDLEIVVTGDINGTFIYPGVYGKYEYSGYDPYFVPDGFKITYAEMGMELKNHISHRKIAIDKLKKALSAQCFAQEACCKYA